MDEGEDVEMTDEWEDEAPEQEIDIERKRKNKKSDPVWKGLLRSKGFLWLATRPSWYGEWSQFSFPSLSLVVHRIFNAFPQAGLMCTITPGGPWFCELPEVIRPLYLPQ